MLARFDERAPTYDRDNAFFTEDFEELRASGYFTASLPDRVRRRRAEPGRDQPAAAPHRLRRPGHRGRGQHAPLLRRAVRRPAPRRRPVRRLGAAARPPTATSSPPATARPATTSRCCCRRRRPNGSTAAGRSPATRSSAACRRCGPTSASTPWTPAIPANPKVVHALRPPRRARLPHRGDVGHARHAGHDVERHDPRPHVRARRGDDPRLPGRVRRRRHVPRRAVRLGAARLRRRLLVDRPPGLRRHRRRACTSARRSRSTRSMAYHPEVQHHVAEMRIHLEAMTAHLDRVCDDWVDRRRPRHGLAGRRSSPASTTS